MFFWGLLCCLSVMASDYDFKVRVLPLKSMDYAIVKKFCEPMLSENGAMADLKARRAVLVHDSPVVIEKVRKFIEQADVELKNIRITVEFAGDEVLQQKEFGTGSDGDWGIRVEDGKVKLPKVHELKAKKKDLKNTSVNVMHLVTISGHAASLWVGKQIPEISYIKTYLARPGVKLRRRGKLLVLKDIDFEMRNVGATLRVRPQLLGEGVIMLELYPEISYISDKHHKRDVIQVESLSSKVVVAPGQKVHIGGAVSHKKKGYTNLFGPDFFKSEDGQKILKMYVTAEIL